MNGFKKSRVLPIRPRYLEMDQERYGATAEEVEWRPPRSVVVGKEGRNIEVQAHNQILRIRAEDSNLGEDFFGFVNIMLLSKPMLPASPLSGKTAH